MKRLLQKFTHWELWPFLIIYAPLGPLWLYYGIKARAFWFFSPVNPTLEFSGFEGEGKQEMYEQLPQYLYPKTIYIQANICNNKLKCAVAEARFTYPFIVKPQVGMQALMFRKIDSESRLLEYHHQMPADYLVQAISEQPNEYSVFHIRYPGQTKGKITGFILKDYLAVTGDGKSNLLQLIRKNKRAKFREDEMKLRHSEHLQTIIANGEKYFLSIAGNHNRGAKFTNLHHEIDEQLCNVFDKISLEAGHFYYGRYDLKCTSTADLKQGKNLDILEYNGTGAEPNHIYDCGMSYFTALREIAKHWQDMYRIGRINHQNGTPYWTYFQGRRHLNKAARFFKILRLADLACKL